MVTRITSAAVVIVYLVIRDILFFSSKSSCSAPHQDDIDHHHEQVSFTGIFYHILTFTKPSYLFIFFIFNILLVGVLLGISSHLSVSSENREELSISSFIDSYEGQKSVKEEKDEDNNIKQLEYFYKDYFIRPGVVYVDYEEEEEEQSHQESGFDFDFKNDLFNNTEEVVFGLPYYGYGDFYDHDYHQEGYNEEFVPKIVHVEYYKKGLIEGVEGRSRGVFLDDGCKKKDDHGAKDEFLIGEFEEYWNYEYDGEEEEEEEYGGYEDLDDIDDFNKRIEQFIDENTKKWREELQSDMLLLDWERPSLKLFSRLAKMFPFIMLATGLNNESMEIVDHYLLKHEMVTPEKINLRAGNHSWIIDVSDSEGHLVLFSGNGWKAFVQQSKLAMLDVILFKSKTPQEIEVSVFDRHSRLLKFPCNNVQPGGAADFCMKLSDGYELVSELPGNIKVAGTNGSMCKVCLKTWRGEFKANLKKCNQGGSFFVGSGWEKFCQEHQIDVTSLLVVRESERFKFDIIACKMLECSGYSVWVERFIGEYPIAAVPSQMHQNVKKRPGASSARGGIRRDDIQFELIIQKYHDRNYMTVPSYFMNLFDLRKKRRAIMCTDKGRFEMEIKNFPNIRLEQTKHVVLRNGWWNFYKVNRLKEGSMCVFKLNKCDEENTSSTCVMDVAIFRP
ncbi:OLC1v1002313C1 [Oldenlandia corymbosa var. corymbosa]|uniref:OLC1v1002313C1 n=1 Tax=Oldenlandia corymbosa var. corymbosa TaxID=529605 RepID=A0AAV1DAT8_OLDCO|nr:OLC1v1002313C1 [Oldenlandia corymbosa var. corymbosa]